MSHLSEEQQEAGCCPRAWPCPLPWVVLGLPPSSLAGTRHLKPHLLPRRPLRGSGPCVMGVIQPLVASAQRVQSALPRAYMSARVILQECWCPTSKKARGARQLIDLAQPLSDSGQHLAVLSFSPVTMLCVPHLFPGRRCACGWAHRVFFTLARELVSCCVWETQLFDHFFQK